MKTTTDGRMTTEAGLRSSGIPQEGPLVSIIVPTYNRARFIRDALESIFSQTYSNWELIVVDDGSTDDTPAIVAEYVAEYKDRVVYLRQENGGVGAARNTGIKHARGELIAFLDDDDIWLPEKLALQVPIFDAYPEVGMVGGGCCYVDAANQAIAGSTPGPVEVSQQELEIWCAMPASGSNEVVRRSVFDDLGLFDTTLARSQDREMWIRISRRYAIRTVPEVTVKVRAHTSARPGVNFDVIRDSRSRINATIPDPESRRRADAWLYYHLFNLKLDAGELGAAFPYLVRSFWVHPGAISRRTPRLQPLLHRVLPRDLVNALRPLYHRIRG